MGVGPWRGNVLELDGNGGRLFATDPDRHQFFFFDVFQNNNGGGRFGGRIEHDPLHLHFQSRVFFSDSNMRSKRAKDKKSDEQDSPSHNDLPAKYIAISIFVPTKAREARLTRTLVFCSPYLSKFVIVNSVIFLDRLLSCKLCSPGYRFGNTDEL